MQLEWNFSELNYASMRALCYYFLIKLYNDIYVRLIIICLIESDTHFLLQ